MGFRSLWDLGITWCCNYHAPLLAYFHWSIGVGLTWSPCNYWIFLLAGRSLSSTTLWLWLISTLIWSLQNPHLLYSSKWICMFKRACQLVIVTQYVTTSLFSEYFLVLTEHVCFHVLSTPDVLNLASITSIIIVHACPVMGKRSLTLSHLALCVCKCIFI